jgi:hypothetical protein
MTSLRVACPIRKSLRLSAELPNTITSQCFSSPQADVAATFENLLMSFELRAATAASFESSPSATATPSAIAPRASPFEPFGSRVTTVAPRRSASSMPAGVRGGTP